VQCGVQSSRVEELWLEIESAYTEEGRFFHDLDHLEHLYRELSPLQLHISDWPTLLFSLVYHDVVYDVTRDTVVHDNEERSAEVAEGRLQSIGYPAEKIEACRRQILATREHSYAQDNDTNLFTDADLSILGQPWSTYNNYQLKIRREYSIYADSIYQAGRRKVLEQFLRMEPLFKTKHFQELYEAAAKVNIRKELALINR
jgi:predicted metal-dependent HD superfamily phosphohydrolase